MATLEEGAAICLSASVVMAGAFPLLAIVSKVLAKPLEKMRKKMGINEVAAVGLVSTLAASITALETMDEMDEKGAMVNAAFTVSAACTFADHLAFTLAYDGSYLFAMIVGKLTAGVLAVAAASFIYKRMEKGK